MRTTRLPHNQHQRFFSVLSVFASACICVLLLAQTSRVAAAPESVFYVTQTERVSLQTVPLANRYVPGQTQFDYNYNAAYAALRDEAGVPYADALFVRCQDFKTPYNIYEVAASQIVLVESGSRDRFFSDLNNITIQEITYARVIINNTDGGAAESYGAEDPRVSYRALNKLYYMFYTAVELNKDGTITARLVLATSQTPPIKSSWVRHGPVLTGQKLSGSGSLLAPDTKSDAAVRQYLKYLAMEGQSVSAAEEVLLRQSVNSKEITWSKSGAVIWRDEFNELPVLLWGEYGVSFAIALDMQGYKYQTFSQFIEKRPGYFDSQLVESGPPPAKLSDGNYFFIYNSAQEGHPSTKPGWSSIYRPGFVILDGQNPHKILQRSDSPILVPTMPYEVGTQGYLALAPIVVFVEGMKELGGDKFLIFYGCADSTLAVATVQVSRVSGGSAAYEVHTEY